MKKVALVLHDLKDYSNNDIENGFRDYTITFFNIGTPAFSLSQMYLSGGPQGQIKEAERMFSLNYAVRSAAAEKYNLEKNRIADLDMPPDTNYFDLVLRKRLAIHIRPVKQHILFVCRANIYRSKMAEDLYAGDERYEVRSAGTDAVYPAHRLTAEDIAWSDFIFAADRRTENIITRMYDCSDTTTSLDLPDKYRDPRIIHKLRKDVIQKLMPFLGPPLE